MYASLCLEQNKGAGKNKGLWKYRQIPESNPDTAVKCQTQSLPLFPLNNIIRVGVGVGAWIWSTAGVSLGVARAGTGRPGTTIRRGICVGFVKSMFSATCARVGLYICGIKINYEERYSLHLFPPLSVFRYLWWHIWWMNLSKVSHSRLMSLLCKSLIFLVYGWQQLVNYFFTIWYNVLFKLDMVLNDDIFSVFQRCVAQG